MLPSPCRPCTTPPWHTFSPPDSTLRALYVLCKASSSSLPIAPKTSTVNHRYPRAFGSYESRTGGNNPPATMTSQSSLLILSSVRTSIRRPRCTTLSQVEWCARVEPSISYHELTLNSLQLSITLALNKVLSTAASLPTFTPAHGHRYFPPVIKSMADATAVAAQGARENSVAPANPIPQSSARDSEDPLSSASSDVAGAHTLYEAFNQYLRYGNEYMDENPLVGEPGAFVFSSSKQQLQAQQQAEQKAPGGKMQIQIQQSASPQPSPLSSPQPLPEVTVLRKPIKVTNQVVNGGQSKPKRRKSKAPTSPASPLNSASLA